MVRRIAILGTGLIGASVGLAAARAGAERVTGFDPDPESLALAVERGAVQAAGSVEEAVDGVDLAVCAAPVAAISTLAEQALAAADCTVTDVGSTKAAVCAALQSSRFIGGHPVAGSEANGPQHARAELFEGATWFLTPSAASEPERYRHLHGFVASLGALPVAVDPGAHDRLLALTSHLPHALSNLLLNQVGASRVDGHEALSAAGGALKDMTRVAGANPRIWVDIFLENADTLAAALAEHRRRTEQLEAALEARDAGFLARWIGEAGVNKRGLLQGAFPDPGELKRVLVRVPDRPGVLAGITQALGVERINIEDFELHHDSPERGGLLSVLVQGDSEAQRAAALLESQGYAVDIVSVLE